MKVGSIAGCALLAFAINGCAAGSDQAPPSDHVGSNTETLSAFGGGSPSSATLYTFWNPATHDLDVQTCNVVHDPNMDSGNVMGHPCTLMFPTRHLELTNVVVTNASGRVVGDEVVQDRPGGGCIHVSIPEAETGGTLYILALGKNLDGSGSTRTEVVFLKQMT